MNQKKPQASTKKPRRVQRKLDPVIRNRFHIDVRSPKFAAGDMEWAKALFALNDLLPKIGLPHFEAHLEEYPANGELTGTVARKDQK